MGYKRSVTVLIFEAVSGGGMVERNLPESWATEGAAIRRALVADFAAIPGVRVVETVDARCRDDAVGPGHVTRIIADPARPIDLDRLSRDADHVLVVAPETDGALAGLIQRVQNAGGCSLGSTVEAIALCADKLKLAEHLARHEVPTPPTRSFAPNAGWPLEDSESGRVVIKPVDGAGAVDTFVLDRSAPCPAAILARPGAIIQRYRPGRSLSASFLIGQSGRVELLAIGCQRITVGPGGAVAYRGGELPVPGDDLDLAPVHRAVEAVPGLRGFVGVDFIAVEPTGGVEIIEINPRVTTSIVALVRLAPPGTIARAWMALALGSEVPDDDLDFQTIRSAPPVRFAADGSILTGQEAPR